MAMRDLKAILDKGQRRLILVQALFLPSAMALGRMPAVCHTHASGNPPLQSLFDSDVHTGISWLGAEVLVEAIL